MTKPKVTYGNLARPKRMTMREVSSKYNVVVLDVMEALAKDKMGALVISASGEAMALDYLRAAMPTKSGLVVGAITDPPDPVKPTTEKQRVIAIANARAVARQFYDKPGPEVAVALRDALDMLKGVM